MKIIRKIKGLRQEIKKIKSAGKSIGFVPTMGALHQGHVSLIRRARRECNKVVVSIFVNPTQFSPKEDYKRYPRNLKKDAQICRKDGVDIIFCPQTAEMYPQGFKSYVSVSGLSDCLCGKSRPGHFKGVATVVAKLFNLTAPDKAYFGQKDAQQAAVIRSMVADLNIPVEIRVLPTAREKDGLALSSRNAYLSEGQRSDALVLSQALKLARVLIKSDSRDASVIMRQMRRLIQNKKSARVDYIALVNPQDLKPLKIISGPCLVALAVYIGKTRLIDNTLIEPN